MDAFPFRHLRWLIRMQEGGRATMTAFPPAVGRVNGKVILLVEALSRQDRLAFLTT